MSYQIITDATADFCTEIFEGLRDVYVIPMDVHIGDETYKYGCEDGITMDEFYTAQLAGAVTSTSQINPFVYREIFEDFLKNGTDVLYLGFSSGMSGSIHNAIGTANELAEEYPERKIICIDTLCASVGEGLLVREAAKRQTEGMSMEELADWVRENSPKVGHWFYVDDLVYLKRGGRISATSAAVGNFLNLKPVLHLNDEGKIETASKAHGRKQAVRAIVGHVAKGWYSDISKAILVGAANAPDRGEEMKKMLLEEFPGAEVYTCCLGPIIGSHTGTGLVVIGFFGADR